MASTLLRGHFYTILPYRPTLNPDEPENQSGTARATCHETSAFALHCPRAASHKWCLCRGAGHYWKGGWRRRSIGMWLSSRRRARPTPGCRSPRSHATHRSPIGLPRITDVLHLAVTIKPAFERLFRGQHMWKIVSGVRAAALLAIFSLAWIPLKGFAQISLPCVPGL